MDRRLLSELANETSLEDVPESCKEVAKIIGVPLLIEISEYAKGDQLYFPKAETIVLEARNRRIKKEYQEGSSYKELAEKYGITTKQVAYILRNEPARGQLSFDML